MTTATAHAKSCEEGAESMGAVRGCIYEAAETPMELAFKKLLLAVSVKNGGNMESEAVKSVVAANISWKQFATDTCNYVSATDDKGIPADVYVNCMIDMMHGRTKALGVYLKVLKTGKAK